MNRKHIEITKFTPGEEPGEERIETDNGMFEEVIKQSGEAQVMIISIVGPYQTGKSSLIKLLTHDEEIKHGDGVQEQTVGSNIYGPYFYNEIRTRFGLSVVDKDLRIYFIDTEGICGFRVASSASLNKILLTQILAPYVALSQVGIIMHKSNIEIGTTKFIKDFFEVVMQLVDEDNSLTLLDVIPSQKFVKTLDNVPVSVENQYINACTKLGEIIPQRIEGINISKFIALPSYSEDDDPLNQRQEFYDRFHFAALDIIKAIEEARNTHKYDAQGIIDEFRFVMENINNKYDLRTLAIEARKKGQFSTAERIYFPQVKRLVEKKKIEILKLYPEISILSSIDERMKEPVININSIISNVSQELNNFDMSNLIKNEAVEKFRQYVEIELTGYNKGLMDEYMSNLQERQKDLLLSEIEIVINDIVSEAKIMLMDNKTTSVDSGKIQQISSTLIPESQKIIDQYSAKYSISEHMQKVVKKIVIELKQQIIDDLIKYSSEIADKNRDIQQMKEDITREAAQRRMDTLKEVGSSVVNSLGGALNAFIQNIDKLGPVAEGLINAKEKINDIRNKNNTNTESLEPPPSQDQNFEPIKQDTTFDEPPAPPPKQEKKPEPPKQEKPAPPPPTPPQSSKPRRGMEVDLTNINLYGTARDPNAVKANTSGKKLYLQDGIEINGRYRVTTAENVGKNPGRATTGWINAKDIK